MLTTAENVDNSSAHHPPPFIFIIENLPNLEENDLPGSYPVLPVNPQDYASVYGPVLKELFSCPLFNDGKIGDVYINFPVEGWFKLDLQAADFWVNVTQEELQYSLPLLLDSTDHVTWYPVPDMVKIMANFPADTRVVGCLAGEEAVGLRALSDYIATCMSTNQTYAFVTQLDIGGELDEFITEHVAVSSGPWRPSIHEVCDKLCKIKANRARPIILVIEELPNLQEDDIPGSYPAISVQPHNYAAVYGPVLKEIFRSPLYRGGYVGVVYVKFPAEGWFKIDPQAAEFWVTVTEERLQNLLPAMFSSGTNDERWSRVRDMAEVMTNFSAVAHIIGCLTGEAAVDLRNLTEYITTTLDDRTHVFVTRLSTGGELLQYIEEHVAVSTGPWTPSVYEVCDQLFKRLGDSAS